MTPKDTIYNGADEKTRAFSAKLIPTKKAIIGLKTPFVESVAKDIAAGKYGDVRIVVGSLSDDVYEELLIKSFVVAKLKTDDETKRADVRKSLPQLTTGRIAICSSQGASSSGKTAKNGLII